MITAEKTVGLRVAAFIFNITPIPVWENCSNHTLSELDFDWSRINSKR